LEALICLVMVVVTKVSTVQKLTSRQSRYPYVSTVSIPLSLDFQHGWGQGAPLSRIKYCTPNDRNFV
jgi:hypothetical protein